MIPKRRKPAKMGREKPQIRSTGHLKWVRGFPCAVYGRGEHECVGKIEAAHVRGETDGGLGVKPGDNWTIPLCSGAHYEQHSIGEEPFEQRHALKMKAEAASLWRFSPHGKRYRLEHQQ